MVGTPKSGALLMLCCVLTIAAVGSIFELSSGMPKYGTSITATILGLSVPLAGWAFYAAVQEARANM